MKYAAGANMLSRGERHTRSLFYIGDRGWLLVRPQVDTRRWHSMCWLNNSHKYMRIILIMLIQNHKMPQKSAKAIATTHKYHTSLNCWQALRAQRAETSCGTRFHC